MIALVSMSRVGTLDGDGPRADADQAQDVDVLAGRDPAEDVGHHQHDRQQQVGADDRELGDGDAGQRRGDEADHEAERPDHELGRRAAVGRAVDGPDAVAQEAPEQPAQQEARERADDDDRRPGAVAPGRREPFVEREGGAHLVGPERPEQCEDDTADNDQHRAATPDARLAGSAPVIPSEPFPSSCSPSPLAER